MRPGVFAVCRTIWDDPDFASEPFTEREAFMWLIGSAAWRETRVRSQQGPVKIDRGELVFSVRFLAEQWDWSKSRVARFLKRLENRDMVRDTSRDGAKIYFIKNYNRFQRVGLPNQDALRDTERDASGTPAGHLRDKEETGKQLKERKVPTEPIGQTGCERHQQAGEEAVRILEALVDIPDDAKSVHDAAQMALEDAGFSVKREYRVGPIGNRVNGRIDLAATKNGGFVAIELDNRKARERSISKLSKCDGFRLIGLRGAVPVDPVEGVHRVVGISVQQAPDSFRQFWAEVPKKVAKRAAEKAYRSALTRATSDEILAGIRRYSAECVGKETQFIAHPATWLNDDRWKDEARPDPPSRSPPSDAARRRAEQTDVFDRINAKLDAEIANAKARDGTCEVLQLDRADHFGELSEPDGTGPGDIRGNPGAVAGGVSAGRRAAASASEERIGGVMPISADSGGCQGIAGGFRRGTPEAGRELLSAGAERRADFAGPSRGE